MAMQYNPDIHHRQSIRLKNYDYSRSGAYFVTICAQGRECLFGKITNGEMALNAAGEMVAKYWKKLTTKYEGTEMDEFVVMPNHFHGIVVLVGADPRVCPGGPGTKTGEHMGSPLHKIVQWFKTMTTNEYLRQIKKSDWPPFPGRLWQRNYYEHIIRNENSLNKIREYIIDNALRWQFDRDNPSSRPDVLENEFWKAFGQNPK